MRRRIHRLALAAATASLLAGASAASTAAHPTTPAGNLPVSHPVFFAQIGGCFNGQVEGQNNEVNVKWRDSAGHLLADFNTTSVGDGEWYPPAGTCDSRTVRVGDTFRAHNVDYDSTRTITIRNITATFNRNSDVVQGTAPTSGSLALVVYRRSLVFNQLQFICNPPVSVNGSGSYAKDLTGCASNYNGVGGDEARAIWFSPGGDQIARLAIAEYVYVSLGKPKLSGQTVPGRDLSFDLHGSGSLLASASKTANGNGRFAATLKDNGSPVNVAPDDVLRGNWGGGGSTYKIPHLYLFYSEIQSKVIGTCTPYTRYGLIVTWDNGLGYDGANGVTDGSGSTGDIIVDSGGHQLQAYDVITFICARKNGDRSATSVKLTSS